MNESIEKGQTSMDIILENELMPLADDIIKHYVTEGFTAWRKPKNNI